VQKLQFKDYFELFGLPISVKLDRSELDIRYLQLQQQYHPDKFYKLAQEIQQQAAQNSAQINEAYNILKDDLKRAKYILQNHGVDIYDQSLLEPEFLMQIMQWQDEIEQYGNDAVKLQSAYTNFQKLYDHSKRLVIGALEQNNIQNATREYSKLQFYNRFIREIKSNLEESYEII